MRGDWGEGGEATLVNKLNTALDIDEKPDMVVARQLSHGD